MYESDWVDEQWMEYRKNHPFTFADVKELVKSSFFVFGTSVAFIALTMVPVTVIEVVSDKTKEKKEVRKEQKQQEQINYEEMLKKHIQTNNENRIFKFQYKSIQR